MPPTRAAEGQRKHSCSPTYRGPCRRAVGRSPTGDRGFSCHRAVAPPPRGCCSRAAATPRACRPRPRRASPRRPRAPRRATRAAAPPPGGPRGEASRLRARTGRVPGASQESSTCTWSSATANSTPHAPAARPRARTAARGPCVPSGCSSRVGAPSARTRERVGCSRIPRSSDGISVRGRRMSAHPPILDGISVRSRRMFAHPPTLDGISVRSRRMFAHPPTLDGISVRSRRMFAHPPILDGRRRAASVAAPTTAPSRAHHPCRCRRPSPWHPERRRRWRRREPGRPPGAPRRTRRPSPWHPERRRRWRRKEPLKDGCSRGVAAGRSATHRAKSGVGVACSALLGRLAPGRDLGRGAATGVGLGGSSVHVVLHISPRLTRRVVQRVPAAPVAHLAGDGSPAESCNAPGRVTGVGVNDQFLTPSARA